MTSLIFYKNPIAIDRLVHGDLTIQFQAKGFAYAATTNSVPLTIAEFAAACHEYPIVFITDENQGGIPVALTGLRDDENVFVNQAGLWDASYIPAYVRRYPFILQNTQENGEFSVLVDAAAEGFGAEHGERLFNADGSNTAMFSDVLSLLNQFSIAAQHTSDFVQRLRQLDLLVPRVISVKTQRGDTFQMNGFSVIDEAKVNALNDADIVSLARTGYLAAIHTHLLSLAAIQKLLIRLERIEQV